MTDCEREWTKALRPSRKFTANVDPVSDIFTVPNSKEKWTTLECTSIVTTYGNTSHDNVQHTHWNSEL
jgi:hypothetical protein